jgi:hypothetical protein
LLYDQLICNNKFGNNKFGTNLRCFCRRWFAFSPFQLAASFPTIFFTLPGSATRLNKAATDNNRQQQTTDNTFNNTQYRAPSNRQQHPMAPNKQQFWWFWWSFANHHIDVAFWLADRIDLLRAQMARQKCKKLTESKKDIFGHTFPTVSS